MITEDRRSGLELTPVSTMSTVGYRCVSRFNGPKQRCRPWFGRFRLAESVLPTDDSRDGGRANRRKGRPKEVGRESRRWGGAGDGCDVAARVGQHGNELESARLEGP